jgi:hypothetical protein
MRLTMVKRAAMMEHGGKMKDNKKRSKTRCYYKGLY